MYTGYFGLSEIPFSIAPNPKFLFMGDRHREALAHLTHGLGDTGGFVLLTGEVGTGKTTISRRLMEQLPENTQTAFILNPTLSSQELLATICDELKIRYRKTGATLKTLTDKIQEKLLKNHEKGLNTLLIIDEAQHLQAEVLEQLRLLTNLETDTKKLLQVILIGQPELKQLLQRRDLRQLAQRITARYHLMPLTRDEVKHYISHRLSIAECHRPIFENSAIKAIHQISQGIPRVINLLCERSLANAYGTNNTVVNAKLVKRSAEEALGDEYKVTTWTNTLPIKNALLIATFSLLFLACIGGGIFAGYYYFSQGQNTQSTSEPNQPSSLPVLADESRVHKIESATETAVAITEAKPATKNENTEVIAKNTHVSSVSEKPVVAPSQELKRATQEPINSTAASDDYQVNATDGVSENMLARFQSAIDETAEEFSQAEPTSTKNDRINADIRDLLDMPEWVQNGVPSLQFEMHIYASDGQGWVRVNGRDRYEGDHINEDLLLERILPQQVILNYKGELFSLRAMSSW